MTPDPNEVVTVYSGSLVVVEAYKQALADVGIESKMTGDSLLASFGSAVPGAVELFVHRRDFDRARAAIERYDRERGQAESGGRDHPHPEDQKAPEAARHWQKHHIPPHPTGQ